MDRERGSSVRLKLAASYAGFAVLAGVLLLAVVWLFLLRYVPDQAGSVAVVDGSDAGVGVPRLFVPGRSDLWRAFAPKAAAALGLLLASGLLGGWVLAGRMLAPLSRITAATRTAARGSLSHRIALAGRHDEFRELADSFDAMLARLEAHVSEQRRFAANASHELRTPLAVSKTLLDVARTDPHRDSGEVFERLAGVNARAIRLTEALLLLSRADRQAFDRELVDLSLVVEEAVEMLLPLAESRGVGLHACGGFAPSVGSPALLLQMATNLVHNAIVHNLPKDGTVEIRTMSGAGAVRLVVENTGELLVPDLVSTLTEPFRRGSERIRTDDAGVGLGLAIVESIIRAHGGSLTLSPGSSGGLRVAVELPAAPALGLHPGGGRSGQTGPGPSVR